MSKRIPVIFDIEADSLYDEHLTRVWVVSYLLDGKVHSITEREDIVALFGNTDYVFIGHNIYCYDLLVLRKLYGIEVSYRNAIDTLALSWYVYPKRASHGLESYAKELCGDSKVEIPDWKNLPLETYIERCEKDVAITEAAYNHLMEKLNAIYDGNPTALINYLSFKCSCLHTQALNPIDVDVEFLENGIKELSELKEQKNEVIRAAMPNVIKYKEVKPPAKVFKVEGGLTEAAKEWKRLTEEHDRNFISVEPIRIVHSEEAPNPQSPIQVKDWLLSLGWKPRTFKKNDKGEKVPQIYIEDGELCPSVLELEHTAIEHMNSYGVIKHRLGLLNGIKKNLDADNRITAEAAGFTNTLRLKHSKLVNLPKPKKLFGAYARGCLVAPKGYVLCGADLSALEDRVKQHYIYPYDPEYVQEMSAPDYDPHLALAQFNKVLTAEQVQAHKDKRENHNATRDMYKQTNYACQYGAHPPKLALTCNIPLEKAQELFEGYWKKNWAVKRVADTWRVKSVGSTKYILNPVNGLWYELRNEKDRFSTVVQSTGAFIFDLWVKGISFSLGAQFHDEGLWVIRDGKQEEIAHCANESIKNVNRQLKLNRDMGIDIKFGHRYSQVH